MNANHQHEEFLRDRLKTAKPGTRAHTKLKHEYERVHTLNHGTAPPKERFSRTNAGYRAKKMVSNATRHPRGNFRHAEENFHKSHVDHTQKKNWYAGESMVLGDRKRAKQQTRTRKIRTVQGKAYGVGGVAKAGVRHVGKHSGAYAGAAVAGVAGYGIYHAHKNYQKERATPALEQHGTQSNARRKQVHVGHAVTAGAIGGGAAYYLARSYGRPSGSSAVIGAAVGAVNARSAYKSSQHSLPNNQPTRKKWTVAEKDGPAVHRQSTLRKRAGRA